MDTTTPRRGRARVLSLGAAIALVGLLLPATAGIASAHNHSVTANCADGVTISLTSYPSSGNTISVWIDSVALVGPDASFGASYGGIWPFSPKSIAHTYRVRVVSSDDTGFTKGFSLDTGVLNVGACKAHLTLIKVVSGGTASASSWTLTATSTNHAGLSGTTPVGGDVDPATYMLSESGTVANYANGTSWVCGPTASLVAAPLSLVAGNSVTLNDGDNITCTISNTYVPPATVNVTFIKLICPTYSVVPANKTPGSSDATGGHSAELDTSYQTSLVNLSTDKPKGCAPASGWQFTLAAGPNRTPIETTPSTDANGSVVVPLPVSLVKATGSWDSGVVVQEVTQAGYGFGALRCYKDINNGDNLEGISGWNSEDKIACIAYNVATPTPTPTPTPPTPPCTTANGCFFTTPTPAPTPTPTGTTEAATATPAATPLPTSSGAVKGATSKPHLTPPPTAALGSTTGQPAGGTWLVLLALAGLLASLLILTPRKASTERRRR